MSGEEEREEARLHIDCIGLYCPEPMFRTRRALDGLEKGEVLEVLADDPAAEEDIPRMVKRLGYKLLKLEKDGDELRFFIEKG